MIPVLPPATFNLICSICAIQFHLSSASTALTYGTLCQHGLNLFPPIAFLLCTLSHSHNAYSPFHIGFFLKSALDLIPIVICASPYCSISLHHCISVLSALERRVPLHLKCPAVTVGGCSYVYHLLPRHLREQQLHNLTRISQGGFLSPPPPQHVS